MATTTSVVLPYAPSFSFSPEAIRRIGSEACRLCTEHLDRIVQVRAHQKTFDNTFLAFENAIDFFNSTVSVPQFLARVHPDKEVRRAAASLASLAQRHLASMLSRVDVYKTLQETFRENPPESESDRFLARQILRDFERNGVNLPTNKREEYQGLKVRLGKLESSFLTAYSRWQGCLTVSASSLNGLSDLFIKS
ncbi:MAG TPA: hypothetical protein PKO06_17310, partial [Candidatus Ozemobacteraceae bacterium]|nr:hypothetical protein [Candidatus Ozemobacteraceae bacterium]